ncbi:hypothetical protein KM043_003739 [Ampulex compressa]|nr:hypothetical protein KM043_003739 [Ampulex compressa]
MVKALSAAANVASTARSPGAHVRSPESRAGGCDERRAMSVSGAGDLRTLGGGPAYHVAGEVRINLERGPARAEEPRAEALGRGGAKRDAAALAMARR